MTMVAKVLSRSETRKSLTVSVNFTLGGESRKFGEETGK